MAKHLKLSAWMLVASLVLAACGSRGTFAPLEDPTAQTQTMFLVTNRVANPPFEFGDRASANLSRIGYEVAIPRERERGQLSFRVGDRDAFGIANAQTFGSKEAFYRAVAQAGEPDAPIGVFVHGYNYNAAEALFRHTQMTEDFDQRGPQITFAWPSFAQAIGYVADRDAATISRDALADFLIDLSRSQTRPIVLVAHSMGSYLVMEALRQMALSGRDITDSVSAIILISPDIDIDLFRSQVAKIDKLPDPTVVVVSQFDRALRVSSRIAGQRPRLGSPDDIETLAGLDIVVMDVSDIRGGDAAGHFSIATSPEAIEIVRSLGSGRVRLEDAPRTLSVSGLIQLTPR